MNTDDVLDDYLVELLGDAQPLAVVAPAMAAALPAPEADVEVQLAADDVTREPTWDDLPDEVVYETGPAPVAADVALATADDEDLQAAFDAVAAANDAPPPVAADDAREPTWDDLPDEVVYETGPAAVEAVPAAAAIAVQDLTPEPTWDDLPDEVIYETDGDASAALTNADSPHLEAAFAAAAEPDATAAATAVMPAAARAVPAPAPAVAASTFARAAPAAPPRPAARAAAAESDERPTTWQELQAQQPATSPHPHRRSNERSTRWLRLRCGAQAYALELLKVQEVVLPVPLLPLRGTRPEMLGIMNLRGQVVPVMDLGVHLGASPAADDALARIVVLEENGEIMGLRVSAVEDVTNLSESQIEPPDTARICRISNEIFRGIARLQQQPMILLDASRLLN